MRGQRDGEVSHLCVPESMATLQCSDQYSTYISDTVNSKYSSLIDYGDSSYQFVEKIPKTKMEPLHHIYNSIMHSVPHLFAVSIIGIVIQASSDSMLAGSVSGVWPMLMSHRDTPGHGIEV